MRKCITVGLALFLFLMGSIDVSANDRKKELREFEHARSATAELFVLNPEAVNPNAIGPLPICGAWNVAKVPGGYELFTAAHCVTLDEDADATEPLRFAVSYTGAEVPILLPATVVAVGNMESLKTDLALLYVRTDAVHDVLALSTETPKLLDRVINWSASYAHIMQGSEGYLAAISVDDPPHAEFDRTNWVVIDGVYKGSSGSAIISVKTGKVIEMVNIGVPMKGFAGVRAERMRVFLAEHIITTTPPVQDAVAATVKRVSPNDQRSLRGGRF